ncbi:MAG: ribonuclease H-like domain-containing protein [Candidatus Shapirobacteria bacterium]|jgi:DEAD/DEAH box helicase domain-containing protein
MSTEVIFDLETKKIFDDIEGSNPADLGVSLVSLYQRQIDDTNQEVDGKMFSFWEEDFAKMWPLFTSANRIIGFNSLKFDVPALFPYCPFDFKKLPHFDLMDHVKGTLGHRLSLDAIASETLNLTKSDHGLNAVYYWQEHTPKSLAKLKHYCENDVLLTRDVYDYGFKNKELKYKDRWNTPRAFPVDFSYPLSTSTPQMGLF